MGIGYSGVRGSPYDVILYLGKFWYISVARTQGGMSSPDGTGADLTSTVPLFITGKPFKPWKPMEILELVT